VLVINSLAHQGTALCWSLRVDCLQVIDGCVSNHRVESLEDLWSSLFSCSNFSNTSTKCSVKCPRGDKVSLLQVLLPISCVVVVAPLRVSVVVPSPVPQGDSFSIARRS
jgi:hypothetical protein